MLTPFNLSAECIFEKKSRIKQHTIEKKETKFYYISKKWQKKQLKSVSFYLFLAKI